MVEIKFVPIEFTDESIGPHLLESITKGLYVNPLHTIREYVQNEVEAEPPATIIRIHIGGNEVSIWGNGGGMNKDIIINNALKIGFSHKDPTKHFGFRGIGIWSGIAVCNTILISTKRSGENRKYLIEINAKQIREEIGKKTKKLTLVLTENTKIAEIPAPLKEYGTHVRLLEILEESKKYLLSPQDIEAYMSLTLPVDFHPNFVFYRRVTEKLRKNVPYYNPIKIFLNEQPIYRAPRINDLDAPEFRILKFENKPLAFCWFCTHRDKESIEEEDSRGLIYKKYGFTVGNRNTCLEWWSTSPHLFNWCVGEIHIIEPKILPNSERTDFESSEEKDRLIDQLQKEIHTTVIEASRKKSHFIHLKNRIKEVNTLPEKPTFTSVDQKTQMIHTVVTLRDQLSKASKHRYTRNFADDKTKKRLEAAIKRSKELVKIYENIPTIEKPSETAKPPIKEKKMPELREIKVRPVSPIPSFSDLLEGVKLEEESKVILENVEEVLDEFIKDPKLCVELKQKIVEKLKEIFG